MPPRTQQAPVAAVWEDGPFVCFDVDNRQICLRRDAIHAIIMHQPKQAGGVCVVGIEYTAKTQHFALQSPFAFHFSAYRVGEAGEDGKTKYTYPALDQLWQILRQAEADDKRHGVL